MPTILGISRKTLRRAPEDLKAHREGLKEKKGKKELKALSPLPLFSPDFHASLKWPLWCWRRV